MEAATEPASDAAGDAAGKSAGWANVTPGLKPGQERGPDGKVRKKAPVLSNARTTDLEAMEFARDNGTPQTHQQAFYFRLKDENPKYFAERLDVLQRENRVSGEQGCSPGPVWDGAGKCPVCKREPEADPGPDDVEKLIDELLAEEPE